MPFAFLERVSGNYAHFPNTDITAMILCMSRSILGHVVGFSTTSHVVSMRIGVCFTVLGGLRGFNVELWMGPGILRAYKAYYLRTEILVLFLLMFSSSNFETDILIKLGILFRFWGLLLKSRDPAFGSNALGAWELK